MQTLFLYRIESYRIDNANIFMMKRIILFFLVLASLSSCNSEENECETAYFGGEIVNPNAEYVVLYDSQSVIDTLYLDNNNRFSYTFGSINSGLHSFIHGGEYQAVIIEPNDSILLRLNTYDFDESLVFTGKGAKKNNFLIDLFLTIESDDKTFYNFSKLEPEVFEEKLDSARFGRLKEVNTFTTRYESSSLFKHIAESSVNFNYYANKELYPFRHFGSNKLKLYKELPESFYSYRSAINFDEKGMEDFYSYYNFLFHLFNNLALDDYFSNTDNNYFNRMSIDYNLTKLKLMNNMVKNDAVRNNLLKYATRNYLSNCMSEKDCDAMYDSFMEKNTDDDNHAYIDNLYSTLKYLKPGNSFPHVNVIDKQNKKKSFSKIIKKPTVIYFWSKVSKSHFVESHNKVKALENEYPDIDFVCVNINDLSNKLWKKTLKDNNFSFKNEYRFENAEKAKQVLAIHYINKVFVLNDKGIIQSSNSNLFDRKFNKLLNKLSE